MGYIKNQEHLRNYIQKVVRESAHILEEDCLMPVGQYVHSAFEYADELTWKMREDVTVLHEKNFWEWLRFKKVAGFSMPSEIDQVTTQIFHETLEELSGSPGVYSFWNKAGLCLYVGVSCDIAGRISTSFTERFKHYADAIFLRYVTTKSASDAAVLEVLFIAKLKPVLNRTSKFDDECTLDFKEPPLSKPIPCNKEGQKVSVRLASNRYETRLDIEEWYNEGLEKDKMQVVKEEEKVNPTKMKKAILKDLGCPAELQGAHLSNLKVSSEVAVLIMSLLRDNFQNSLFYGPPGCGKTRLAWAIIEHWLEEKCLSAHFVTWDALHAAWLDEYRENGIRNMSIKLSETPFLVIDDICMREVTENFLSWLQVNLGVRYDNKLPTIYTSNHSPGAVREKVTEPIWSRMSCRAVYLSGDDFRLS